jgi:hypothetical protein
MNKTGGSSERNESILRELSDIKRLLILQLITLICLGSSDQSKLESCRSDLVVGCHVLRSEFGRCQIAET